MQKLIQGIHKFQDEITSAQEDFFKKMAKGQDPDVLFITCSDSRINPNLFTQTDPGELFILRNAGNLIPPYGEHNGGEAATIEFAVQGLEVKDIIICGHTHCGAMKALLDESLLEGAPAMKRWLEFAKGTKDVLLSHYQHLEKEKLAIAAVEENVLMQIENLRTHPSVAKKLLKGNLRIHAWVYKIENGEVFKFHQEEEQFVSLSKKDAYKYQITKKGI